MKLQKLQCDQCGGHIDGLSLTCESCGMQYRIKEEFGELSLVRIVKSEVKFTTYCGCVAIPAYYVIDDPKSAMEMSIMQMAEQLSIKIAPLIEVQQMFDPPRDQFRVYGRIRVADPLEPNVLMAEYDKMTMGRNLLK